MKGNIDADSFDSFDSPFPLRTSPLYTREPGLLPKDTGMERLVWIRNAARDSFRGV